MMNTKNKIERTNNQAKKLRSFIQNLCFLFLFLALIFFFVDIRAHEVDGDSMLPTLKNKDRVLIKKGKATERYAIVTFQPREESTKIFVKRVLGLPGDQISLEKNTLSLRRKDAEKGLDSADKKKDFTDGTLKVQVTWETVAKLQQITVIPDDQYFVLGDNRDNSVDSRHLGLIKSEQIEGSVVFRYFPFNRGGFVE